MVVARRPRRKPARQMPKLSSVMGRGRRFLPSFVSSSSLFVSPLLESTCAGRASLPSTVPLARPALLAGVADEAAAGRHLSGCPSRCFVGGGGDKEVGASAALLATPPALLPRILQR